MRKWLLAISPTPTVNVLVFASLKRQKLAISEDVDASDG